MSSTCSDQTASSPEIMPMSQSPSPPLHSKGDGRQLPSIPNTVPYTPGPQNINRVGTQAITNRGGSNGYGPFFQEYSIMAEYNQLHVQKIPGVYVMPCAKSPLVWTGLIFIRQGIYQGAALRFTLTIPENYPDGDCPKFEFEFPVFHPMVDAETGELNVKQGFPRWRRNVNHLWQVVLYAKKVFYKISTQCPSNPEAAVLYDQDPDLFKSRVAESIKQCKERLYQSPDLDDPYALRFSPWSEAVHPDTKRQMIQSSRKPSNGAGSANPSDLGLSWMDSSNGIIFARDEASNT